ncbi:MAG: hypothetical protein AAF645_28335, partial [Myxococcota bacterium]
MTRLAGIETNGFSGSMLPARLDQALRDYVYLSLGHVGFVPRTIVVSQDTRAIVRSPTHLFPPVRRQK